MLATILFILKMIGIILLSIIGLILLILLLVLIIPIKYRISGYYHESYQLSLNLTWFFRLLRLSYEKDSEHEGCVRFYILGKRIQKRERKKKVKNVKHNYHSGDRTAQFSGSQNESIKNEIKKEDDFIPNDDMIEQHEQPDTELIRTASKGDKKERKTVSFWLKDHLRAFIKQIGNIKCSFLHLCDTIKDISNNIQYYISIIKSDEFKCAFEKCKKQLSRIVNHIKPKHMDIQVQYGDSEQPDMVGTVLGIWGMTYPIHQGKIKLDASFEEDIFELDFALKGHMSWIIHLKTIHLWLFDKNIKYLKECVMREA